MIAKVSSLCDEEKLCQVIINLCERIIAQEKVTHVRAEHLRKRCDLAEKRLNILRQKRKGRSNIRAASAKEALVQ